tara:strand:- start:779 stop:1099 length:321 start_codon:yes stop_codon:yes gene_type:complete
MKKNRYIFLIFIFFLNFIFFRVNADPKFDIGKKIFINKGECGACHSLNNANTHGQIGPNLNQIQPDLTRVILAVTNGIGVMPSYEGQLSDEEIEAVSYYVSKSSAE